MAVSSMNSDQLGRFCTLSSIDLARSAGGSKGERTRLALVARPIAGSGREVARP
jgi:hypothetical protein